MFEKCCIIANPIAGSRSDRQGILDAVTKSVAESVRSYTVEFTSGRGDAMKIAERQAREGSDLILVVGGDGTVNEVAAALVNSSVAMGIIPCGSGNGLARSLEIPLSVDLAVRLLTKGTVKSVDAGQINGRPFVLVAGIGFDAAVGKRFDDFHKRGALAYFYVGAKEFFRFRPAPVRINLGARTLEAEPFLVAVANGTQYGNNALIAPQAKLDDGLFDITIIHRFTIFDAITQMPKLFQGDIADFPHAEFYQSSSVRIERAESGLVNVDGEPCLEGAQLEVCILPKALRMLVPMTVSSLER